MYIHQMLPSSGACRLFFATAMAATAVSWSANTTVTIAALQHHPPCACSTLKSVVRIQAHSNVHQQPQPPGAPCLISASPMSPATAGGLLLGARFHRAGHKPAGGTLQLPCAKRDKHGIKKVRQAICNVSCCACGRPVQHIRAGCKHHCNLQLDSLPVCASSATCKANMPRLL
jgi:hypothetical protein